MKKLLVVIILAGLAYGGYMLMVKFKDSSMGEGVRDMAGGQLQRGRQAVDTAKDVAGEVAVKAVRRAVQGFKDQFGKYPDSLQDLVDKGLITELPGGLSYNPETGEVSRN